MDSARTNHPQYSKNSSDLESNDQEKRSSQTLATQISTHSPSYVDDSQQARIEAALREEQAFVDHDLDKLLSELEMDATSAAADVCIAAMGADETPGVHSDNPASAEAIPDNSVKTSEDLPKRHDLETGSDNPVNSKRFSSSNQSDRSVNADAESDNSVNQPENLPDFQNEADDFDDPIKADRIKDDGSVKKSRTVSPYRDATFVRDLEALLASKPGDKFHGTSVVPTLPSSTSLPAGSTSSSPLGKPGAPSPFMLPIPPSLTALSKPVGTPRTKMRPWWRDFYLANPARSYRVPAEWRDTSDVLQVLYRHIALRTFGQVHSFSLNFAPDVEREARSQAAPIDWLHKRIARNLADQLGRAPQFHLVLEEAEQHRLHLHGEIQVSAEEAEAARKALRLAGGEWEEVRQHQAHTDADPDQGWASYIAKDLWRIGYTRSFLPRYGSPRSRYAITFEGSPFSSTMLLKQKSAEIYNEHRALTCGTTI